MMPKTSFLVVVAFAGIIILQSALLNGSSVLAAAFTTTKITTTTTKRYNNNYNNNDLKFFNRVVDAFDDQRERRSRASSSSLATTIQPYLQQQQQQQQHIMSSSSRISAFRLEATSDSNNNNNNNNNNDVTGPLTLLLFSQFLLFIGVGAVIPSIPLYGKELGFSSAANGIVISAPAVALLLLSKFGGNFADQARKPAMIIGMGIIAISDVGTALANGLPMLLIARLGLGAGRCISESGERGLLADLANQIPELRGRALAAQQAVVALGIAIGAPLGGVIVEEYGPRAAFLCVSAAAVVALVLYLFLPETMTTTASSSGEKEEVTGVENADWGDFLAQNRWRGLALCQSGASFGFAAKIASIPVLATATLPGGAVGAGLLLSGAGLSGLVGAPVGGLLTDRFGSKTTAILSGTLSALSLILIPLALGDLFADESFRVSAGGLELAGRSLAFSVVVLGWSIGAAAQGPALTALAQQQAPKGAEATAMALPRAAGDGTYIVAPFILGLVTDAAVNAPGAECAVAGLAGVLGVLSLATLGEGEEQEL